MVTETPQLTEGLPEVLGRSAPIRSLVVVERVEALRLKLLDVLGEEEREFLDLLNDIDGNFDVLGARLDLGPEVGEVGQASDQLRELA